MTTTQQPPGGDTVVTFVTQGDFKTKVTDLPDQPSPAYTASQIKSYIQNPSDELKDTLNANILALQDKQGSVNIGAMKLDGTKTTAQNLFNDAQTRLSKNESDISSLQTTVTDNSDRIDNIVGNAGTSNTEIVDARYDSVNGKTYTLLKDRLDNQSSQLADIVTNVDRFGAIGDGTNDDTNLIQNALNIGKNKQVLIQLSAGKTYKITKPLILYDNTIIMAYGATLKLMATEQHFIVNECFLDTSVRTRNKNISIFGGTFDTGTYSGTGINNLRCIFWHVDNLTIRDAIGLSQSGKYMFALADTTNVNIDNIYFDAASDGIHLLGKNYNTSITNINGTCGDDMVAITTQDYADYAFDEGDVDDLKIENITGSNPTRIVLLGNTKYTIKNIDIKNIRQKGTGDIVYIGDGGVTDDTILVDNVTIENVYSDDPTNLIQLRHRNIGKIELKNIQNKINASRDGTTGDIGIDTFIVRNCYANIWIESYCLKLTNVIIENLFGSAQLSGEKSKVYIKNMIDTVTNYALCFYGHTTDVLLDSCKLNTTGTGDDPIIVYQGIIDNIRIINSNIKGGGNSSNCVLLDSRSTGTAYYCTRITFDHCEIGDHKLVYRSMYNGTDVNTELILSETTVTATNRLVENLANYNLVVKYNNFTIVSALNELFRFTTGKKLTLYGKGWITPAVTIVGTLTVESYAQDFPADASLLSKIAKGACYNTNASLSCGVGFLISNGTNWKNLFSGSTY